MPGGNDRCVEKQSLYVGYLSLKTEEKRFPQGISHRSYSVLRPQRHVLD